jgi:microcystin-dependent protein
MSDFFIGEIKIFGFGFAPKYWAQCNGQTLSIAQNAALFSLLGTTYGGDGRITFALPDFRGRTPVHVSDNGSFTLGQRAGSESHSLIVSEMPVHTHTHSVSSATGAALVPINNSFSSSTVSLYATQNNQATMPALGNAGGSQPHTNLQPYLTLNVCIATSGIFPSRN